MAAGFAPSPSTFLCLRASTSERRFCQTFLWLAVEHSASLASQSMISNLSRFCIFVALCLYWHVSSIWASKADIPDFDDEVEMEKLFAKHAFDDVNTRGGVLCHQGMTSLQSRNPLVSNGCTGADLLQSKNNEDFTHCCDIHDACYQICGMSQKKCDTDFKKCMKNMCETVYSESEQCPNLASLYHLATSTLGSSFYQDSQSDNCICGDMRASNVIKHYTQLIDEFYKSFAPEQQHRFDISRYSDFKSSARKWASLLYALYKKYPLNSIRYTDDRAVRSEVPRPPGKQSEL